MQACQLKSLDVGWDRALDCCWGGHVRLRDLGVLGQHLSEVLSTDGLINDEPLHNLVNCLPVFPEQQQHSQATGNYTCNTNKPYLHMLKLKQLHKDIKAMAQRH